MKTNKSFQEIQAAMIKIKSEWPSYKSYVGLYKEEFGELSESETKDLMNFWNLRRNDEKLLKDFEKIHKKYNLK